MFKWFCVNILYTVSLVLTCSLKCSLYILKFNDSARETTPAPIFPLPNLILHASSMRTRVTAEKYFFTTRFLFVQNARTDRKTFDFRNHALAERFVKITCAESTSIAPWCNQA